MTKAKVRVQIPVGLHARPVSLFVQECQKRKSRVVVEAGGRQADGRSILQVLALGVGYGQEIVIRVDGDDEIETMTALVSLISKGS